jgi:hypothetical protein
MLQTNFVYFGLLRSSLWLLMLSAAVLELYQQSNTRVKMILAICSLYEIHDSVY